MIDRFPDGIFFVSLATVIDPAAVLPTVASTLAIHDVPAEPALETLVHALRDQTLLLVLDNLEQVAGADVEVAALMAALPRVTILATSRVALNVRGERRWQVPTWSCRRRPVTSTATRLRHPRPSSCTSSGHATCSPISL